MWRRLVVDEMNLQSLNIWCNKWVDISVVAWHLGQDAIFQSVTTRVLFHIPSKVLKMDHSHEKYAFNERISDGSRIPVTEDSRIIPAVRELRIHYDGMDVPNPLSGLDLGPSRLICVDEQPQFHDRMTFRRTYEMIWPDKETGLYKKEELRTA